VNKELLLIKYIFTECRVDFDYEAQEEDELCMKKGDIITDVVEKTEGWWEGSIKGKRGLFPDNFVTVLPKVAIKSQEQPDPEVMLRKKSASHPRYEFDVFKQS